MTREQRRGFVLALVGLISGRRAHSVGHHAVGAGGRSPRAAP